MGNSSSTANFESDYWYTAIIFLLIYNIITVIAVESCRRYKISQIILCCLIIPFAPIYMYYSTLSLFGWAKVLSVVLHVAIAIIIRYYKQNKYLNWALCIVYILNIFEAFLVELGLIFSNNIFYLNTISAIILIICLNLPFQSSNVIFVNNEIYKTINYDMGGIYYIITYTVWNWSFALNYKCYEKLLISTVHLGVPLYFLVFDKINCCKKYFKMEVLTSEWLFLRACSLLFYLYFESMPFDESIPFWDIVECENVSVNIIVIWICNTVSLLCCIGLLLYQIYPLIHISVQTEIENIHKTADEENQENEEESNKEIQPNVSAFQLLIKCSTK